MRAPVTLTAAVLSTGVVGVPDLAIAGAQTFNTALPVAEGNVVLRQQAFYRSAGDDPTAADGETTAWGTVSVLAYGVTGELTLFGAVPVVNKTLTATPPTGARVERESAGLGDVRVFGRYTAYRDDAPGRTFRIAPFAGIEAPTGPDDDRDRLGRLPQPLQLGSGSWDPFGGVVATWQTLAYEIDAQLAYKANTEANGFEFGDVARADASVQYRVWPRDLGAGVPGFVYATLGANAVDRQENEIGGVADPASGGMQVFLAPGVQYVTKRWVVEAVAQVPVAQDLNAAGFEDDVILRAGFRIAF